MRYHHRRDIWPAQEIVKTFSVSWGQELSARESSYIFYINPVLLRRQKSKPDTNPQNRQISSPSLHCPSSFVQPDLQSRSHNNCHVGRGNTDPTYALLRSTLLHTAALTYYQTHAVNSFTKPAHNLSKFAILKQLRIRKLTLALSTAWPFMAED